MDKTKLIQLLGLAEDATDEDIVRAIKAGAKAVGELAEARAAADAAEADKSAIANERDGLKTALANERAARHGLILDRAVAEGRIAESDRGTWSALLSADDENGAKALANLRRADPAGTALPPAARFPAKTPAAAAGFTAPDGRAFANCAAYYETLTGKERRAFREAHFGELMDEARKAKAAKAATV